MMQGILEEATGLELQHINVKLLLQDPEQLDLETVVNVFHSWIQEQVCEELLLDVADYRHVYRGPGVVLIGHEADYSIDNTNGRLGIRYNRKASVEGSNPDRLAQAVRAALIAAQHLQQDTHLNNKCHFNGHDIEIFVNDRILVPNTAETRQAAEGEFRTFLSALLGPVAYDLEFQTDRRRLFGARIRTEQPLSIVDLLESLRRREARNHGLV